MPSNISYNPCKDPQNCFEIESSLSLEVMLLVLLLIAFPGITEVRSVTRSFAPKDSATSTQILASAMLRSSSLDDFAKSSFIVPLVLSRFFSEKPSTL